MLGDGCGAVVRARWTTSSVTSGYELVYESYGVTGDGLPDGEGCVPIPLWRLFERHCRESAVLLRFFDCQ